jgi:hypothetical protein
VFEEAFVFGGEGGFDEVIRDLLQCGRLMAKVVLAREVCQFPAVAVKEDAVRGGRVFQFLWKRSEEGDDREK